MKKYMKYKNKYLQLKQKMSVQNGGNINDLYKEEINIKFNDLNNNVQTVSFSKNNLTYETFFNNLEQVYGKSIKLVKIGERAEPIYKDNNKGIINENIFEELLNSSLTTVL